VAVLAPHQGKVLDPCCGSGGMFVQSEEFIEAHGGKLGDVAIYGQEANPTTWRLAAMNLAIRGIDFNLGREPADSFTRDQFPDLRADFILATRRSTSATGGTPASRATRAGCTATRRRATPTTPGCSTCCTT
jgi:type I restriction-modification system DNA methylase subunit